MALQNQSSQLTAASTTGTAGASAQLIAANSERNGLRVTVDTAAAASVYLLLGTGTASATNFHIVLAAGGSWDGLVSRCLWTGAVQYYSSAGGKVGVAEV
jgi:hypothetical protein